MYQLEITETGRNSLKFDFQPIDLNLLHQEVS
jgi:hypothetical protein